MRELVVISGKGGTGKTSIVASFAALAAPAVLADCDVDAADLHLVLDPQVQRTEDFSGGKRARVLAEKCIACGKCREVCRFDAISFHGPGNGGVSKTFRIDPVACEGCGVCAWFCPAKAIDLAPVVNGQWFVSQTRHGPLVHARLGVAQENPGKLVSTVRQAAREIADERRLDLVIVDGSPGIGLPRHCLDHRSRPIVDCDGADAQRTARPGAGCRPGPTLRASGHGLHQQVGPQSRGCF